jgi:hypothetical protein
VFALWRESASYVSIASFDFDTAFMDGMWMHRFILLTGRDEERQIPKDSSPSDLSAILSHSELESFLAVFPDISGESFEIKDESPFYPQSEKRDNSLDMNITIDILGWNPPD